MGLTKDDIICVPAAIAFGFTGSADTASSLTRLFCDAGYFRNEEAVKREAASIKRLGKEGYKAIVLAPLQKAVTDPDTILFYGNPAQVMRLIQAWAFLKGEPVQGNFGGKAECAEYLLVPFKKQAPRIALHGTGDRVFSMTQDEEMVFSLPGQFLTDLLHGLKEAGEKVGARYPIPVFLNFQPEFPNNFRELGKELGIQ